MIYEIGKYKRRWAVFNTVACVWYFVKGGRKACERFAEELNRACADIVRKQKEEQIKKLTGRA